MRNKRWRIITKTSGVILLLVIMWIGYQVFRGCQLGLEAEYELQAMRFMSHLLTQYVETNDGKWPSSWHDLEKVEPQYKNLAWPESVHDISECITIDFSADPAILATQEPQSFNALRARKNFYSYNSEKIIVIEALRKKYGNSITTHKAPS